MSSDAEFMALLESRKKSGLVAALLNLFLPGAGYIYCGRWFLGIIAFFMVVAMFIVSFGLAAVGIIFILVVDGLLCAGRYNRNLTEEMISKRRRSIAKDERPAQNQSQIESGWRGYGLPEPVKSNADTKKCPFCAEEVKLAAIKCKHCGSELPV